MIAAVNAALGTFWAVLAFVALRWAGRRFFSGPYRADIAAAVMVMLFALGAVLISRVTASSTARVPPPNAPAAGPVMFTSGADVTALCRSIRLARGGGNGALDVVLSRGEGAGEVIVPRAGGAVVGRATIVAQGWAANESLRAPARGACFVIDGRVASSRARYGTTRSDVAAAFSRGSLTATGYVLELDTARLTPGKHRIEVAAVGFDGTARTVNGAWTLTVRR